MFVVLPEARLHERRLGQELAEGRAHFEEPPAEVLQSWLSQLWLGWVEHSKLHLFNFGGWLQGCVEVLTLRFLILTKNGLDFPNCFINTDSD